MWVELRQAQHLFEAPRNLPSCDCMRAEELETPERSVMAAVEHNKLLTTKRPVEFIKRSTASASLRIAL